MEALLTKLPSNLIRGSLKFSNIVNVRVICLMRSIEVSKQTKIIDREFLLFNHELLSIVISIAFVFCPASNERCHLDPLQFLSFVIVCKTFQTRSV